MNLSPSSLIRFGHCELYSDTCSETCPDTSSKLSCILAVGCKGTVMAVTCMDDCLAVTFGVVLSMPCLGCFICPFAVAGLGFKYFRIKFSLMFGHPFRNPLQTAFKGVNIFGLHKDWCVNITALTPVLIEWVNVATSYCLVLVSPITFGCGVWPIQGPKGWCGARLIQGLGCGRVAS
jgi:hypothetical protein